MTKIVLPSPCMVKKWNSPIRAVELIFPAAGQSAEYGTFRRDLRCAGAKLPVCRCASPIISGVLVYTKPLWLKFGKVIVHFLNTFVCKIYFQNPSRPIFLLLKIFKNSEYKMSKHGIGIGVQSKSRGHVLKKFPGGPGGIALALTAPCLFVMSMS